MTIFVHETGPHDAGAVVLLHAVGTTGWMWEWQVTALESDLRVLVPDLPGHGRSAAVPWEAIGGTAALVAELIAARAPSVRAPVVGLSLGGYVAATLAATAPDVVASAIVSGVNVLPFPNPGRLRLMGALMAPVAGEKEHDLTRRSPAEIAAAFPNGEARLAPGVGHAWSGEKPDLFTAMIRAHLSGSALPGTLTHA
ncbi:alpha/beta fold hydrolase [Nonomuraea sp. NPDC049421]|uniref:alpha/beta fold hydrolase n=1 Tax=Nonomuraea sp. NPDC049421 TaxID=3155275 RepID=UPI003421058D